MRRNLTSFSLHLLLFLVVELLFVFVIFHELPETNLLTGIGIGHASYWLILLIAGGIREKLHKVRQRFLATFLPIVYHVCIHIRIGAETIHEGELHHQGEHIWIIIGTIAAGGMILWGEMLLHKKYHCDTHHMHDHEHCQEKGHEECENPHRIENN